MIVVPFSILPPVALNKSSRIFYWLGSRLAEKNKLMELQLEQAGFKISAKEYLSMCITSSFFFWFIFSILTSIVLDKLNVNLFFGIISVFLVSLFIFGQQLLYPKLTSNKKISNIERNLIPALQNLLVQLSSGVPLFNAIVSISDANYGGVSKEFKIAVRKINAGNQQIVVLEQIAKENPSLHFRRVLWQIINGMKTGSDMADVIRNSIDNLSEEQLIQIQQYGAQLNPLAMFYMIVAVIIPSLGITFVILLSSFLNLSSDSTKFIFWGILTIVFFFQLMFLGLLKSRRPNLL